MHDEDEKGEESMRELTWEEWTKDAVQVGEYEGIATCVLKAPYEGLNGYAYFPSRPVREEGYDGIVAYVPVHGGITFARPTKDGGIIYGFDTGHCDSDKFPRYEPEWIMGQIAAMISGLKRAAEVEQKYLKAMTNKGKAKHISYVYDTEPDKAGGYSFGIMLNLLGGKL